MYVNSPFPITCLFFPGGGFAFEVGSQVVPTSLCKFLGPFSVSHCIYSFDIYMYMY